MVTPTQHKIYQFIKDYMQRNGISPSLQEIANGIGIKSRSLISRYVHILNKKGHLTFSEDNGYRRIRIPESDDNTFLPLVGKIAAGSPIEAISQEGKIVFSDLLGGSNRYALQVKGDSMVDEGILDGDIVICEKAESAREGDIVVALIDNQEATLKRIQFMQEGKIALIPANVTHKPMIYPGKRVNIQGIFIGLLRLSPYPRSNKRSS